jgi:lipopolysaccharide export system ATP-binding protein
MHTLEVVELHKSYGKKHVIKGVNIKVSSNEIVAILGPNGAGKTTCFYAIVGIVKPDRGLMKIDDQEISKLPIFMRSKLGISYLPQESSIFKNLTVEQNIISVLEYSKYSKEKQSEILTNLLDEFKIKHLRKSLAMSLSGGERRRLEVARCIATDPNFILLDEPFAGVDPVSVKDVIEIIKKLKTKGIGVIITDHNVKETLKIASRCYIINNGTVLIEGEPKKIIKDENVRKYYLGEDFE